MVKPLASNDKICSVYGRFSFIPIGTTGRFTYFFYEYFADLMRWINKIFRDEAMNAYGFNSGFRREQGLTVEGFNHPPGTNEDGWLALKLREKGYGKLYYVTNIKALVWTTDRRIQIDGGLYQRDHKKTKKNDWALNCWNGCTLTVHMKAIVCTQHGGPELLQLIDTPTPEISGDQVLVDVYYCGVNFPDTLIIQDKYQFKPPLPFLLVEK